MYDGRLSMKQTMVREISLQYVRVGCKHLDHCLCESFHVAFPYLFVLAFQFLKDLKTLSQLSEDIYDAVGEVGVLGVLLKLVFFVPSIGTVME